MDKFVTLYYGNFAILGEWVKEFSRCTSCSNWFADRTLWGQIFLNELKRAPKLDHHPQAVVGTLLIWVPAPQCGLHEEEALKVFPKITGRGSQRDGPWTHLHVDPHRYHWWSHSTSGWTSLPREVDIGSHCALPSKAGWLYEGATMRIKHMYV